MIDEIKKSINASMYERAKSPLFGTFIFSWIVWNWRIIYVTIFMSRKVIPNKLEFINQNLLINENLILYPLYSTIVFLTIIPFISNGAFWLNLKFKKWRIDQRHKIEMKQLLTVEHSIKLREQIRNQEDRFHKITEEKDTQIRLLNIELEETRKLQINKVQTTEIIKQEPDLEIKNKNEYNKLFSNNYHVEQFKSVKNLIDTYSPVNGNIEKKMVDFFEMNNLINREERDPQYYNLTEFGKTMYKILLNKEFGID